MSVKTNWFLQALAIAGQVLNGAQALPLPPKAQPILATALTIFQTIVGIVAHYSPVPTPTVK